MSKDKYIMDFEKPPIDDHEAKMARAELYKLAKYSAKLFKMIDEGEELEGWVQSKITKASDYISSVYHWMEYEKMSNESINLGPREFEEAVQAKIKDNLKEAWIKKQSQGN